LVPAARRQGGALCRARITKDGAGGLGTPPFTAPPAVPALARPTPHQARPPAGGCGRVDVEPDSKKPDDRKVRLSCVDCASTLKVPSKDVSSFRTRCGFERHLRKSRQAQGAVGRPMWAPTTCRSTRTALGDRRGSGACQTTSVDSDAFVSAAPAAQGAVVVWLEGGRKIPESLERQGAGYAVISND